jgi:hypothetical protein
VSAVAEHQRRDTVANWAGNGVTSDSQVVIDRAGVPGRTLPLRNYPIFPKYKGGWLDVDLASSFACSNF